MQNYFEFTLARTTGLEPAISNLKGWRLNRFAYGLARKVRVKRFELLHELGLSQSPLPFGLHALNEIKYK